MHKASRIELVLDGLNCANCAAKIEKMVNRMEGVITATLDFITKTLVVEVDSIEKINEVISEVREVVTKFEPHVTVRRKTFDRSSQKVLVLMGLNCSGCARKIEDSIKEIKGVKMVRIDLAAGKVIIGAAEKDIDRITEKATDIIKSIEPGVKVIDGGTEPAGRERDLPGYNMRNSRIELLRLSAGAVLFAVAVIFKFRPVTEFILYLAGYIVVGGEIVLRAVKNVFRGQLFDENFLMSTATLGAFAIGEYPEGVAVMLFYRTGEYFQNLAVNRSRKSIAALMNIRPDYANVVVGENIGRVSPEQVGIGDIVLVKPGEKIPLDGRVVEGTSMVDTSALTGESVPRKVTTGSQVLGGFINNNGVLKMEVVKEFGASTAARILELVESAGSKKAPVENFITRFARYYTPVVVFSALGLAVIPPLVLGEADFSQWIYRALIFLVISCPCALVISIPLSFFGGIGGASRNGVLVKGGNYLEALNRIDTVIFDKTGTLTRGVFEVTDVLPAGDTDKEELLTYAACAESYSNHPIAASVLKAYGKEVDRTEIQNYDEISGHGIKTLIGGKEILAGNAKLMNKRKIDFQEVEADGTVVYVAVDGEYRGSIIISDEVKEDALKTVKDLKSLGVRKIVMLTGDSKSAAGKVAGRLGLDDVYAELLPDQKVEKLEMLMEQKETAGRLVFVGDGVNDAPVLARSDVGVAMGALGSDAAIEAADVVLMTDEPHRLVDAVKIARRTRNIVWQNIVIALGVKAAVLVLGAGGLATMWEAVFADVGVALIAVLNAMRAMKI